MSSATATAANPTPLMVDSAPAASIGVPETGGVPGTGGVPFSPRPCRWPVTCPFAFVRKAGYVGHERRHRRALGSAAGRPPARRSASVHRATASTSRPPPRTSGGPTGPAGAEPGPARRAAPPGQLPRAAGPVLDRVVAAGRRRRDAVGQDRLPVRPPVHLSPRELRPAARARRTATAGCRRPEAALDAASSGAAGRGRPARAAGSRSAAGVRA